MLDRVRNLCFAFVLPLAAPIATGCAHSDNAPLSPDGSAGLAAGEGGAPSITGGASATDGGVGGASAGASSGSGGAPEPTEPVFDASGLSVTGPSGPALCRLSADWRYLQVTVANQGSTAVGATIVQVATDGTAYKSQLRTPKLEAGTSATLQFDRGPLIGFTKTWSFSVVIDPDGKHGGAHAPLTGACQDLRSRSEAGMVPLDARYDVASGLFDKNAWWTGANVLESSIDYMRETGDMTYSDMIDNTFVKNQAGQFLKKEWNPRYYDDEGWWALAWIKAYDLSHQVKYLEMAKTIFKDLTGSWSEDCGGGIWWNTDRKYKNSITNELFMTTAVRLHQRTPGDAGAGSYLDWATRDWNWFKASGLLRADHQIVDGIKVCGTPNTFNTQVYTYNQGVILGALADLAQSTGDAALLDTADQIAQTAMQKKATADGIISEGCENSGGCGDGDGEIFKGVLARNLAYLYRARQRAEYRTFLIKQSDTIWSKDRSAKNEFGLIWQGPFDKLTSSRQSSALDALNGAIIVANDNLSLHATVTGSPACSAAEPAENAADGSSRFGAKWCSGGMSGQTLSVDLGAARYVVGFRVRHAGAGLENPGWNTRDFEIEVSLDGTMWSPAVTVTGNTSDVTTHPIAGLSARYARLHVTQAQTSPDLPAARIYELEVLGIGQ